MKAFFGRFFWGFVSNDEYDVSTPGCLAVVAFFCWLCGVGPAGTMDSYRALGLVCGLMAVPKVSAMVMRGMKDK